MVSAADARAFIATYRLQMGPDFTFADAVKRVPHIAGLGVSHLYLSPIWECVPGSSHGYDVVDHDTIRADLGGRPGFMALHAAARARGLGIVIDIVPNHVGIAAARHPWWRDVLREGESSAHAAYFDIDWRGHSELPPGVLVLPALGRPFGEALEAGEIGLAFDGAELVVRCNGSDYPVAPETYARVLGRLPLRIRQFVPVPASASQLPPFAEAINESREARQWLDSRLQALAGTPGDHASWDRLEAILLRQHYRLAFWRVSGEQINYRRFFEINDLAAIRQEEPDVFDETHALLGELLSAGLVDGVRVDHVDGLHDPAGYLKKLASITDGAPIWVEKILARDERLPSSWPVAGTTGYDFLAMADGLFVDPAAEQQLTRNYQEFTGDEESFAMVAAESRHEVASSAFAGEISVLAAQLFRLAQADRRYRDVTLGALRDAIEAILASFPVYRTYSEGGELRPGDRKLVDAAAAAALDLDPALVPSALEFLVRVLLLENDRPSRGAEEAWSHFRQRFQQISGPIMAKGVEDTAFFRYSRLLTLNEVGASPAQFGVTSEAFHAWAMARAASAALALSATSTHDTKRSEDARMRLAVLSEAPSQWRREVRAWARLNARHKTSEGTVPGPATEYYFYQSFVAAFEGDAAEGFATRMVDHMRKASREAGLRTSWSSPDDAFEEALEQFVRACLDPRRSKRFLARLSQWIEAVRPAAESNSLGLLAVKCLAPGVPDIYQGTEGALFALTDPDNRRLPDYQSLARMGKQSVFDPGAALGDRKAWLLKRLLRFRREMPGVFAQGSWEPLVAEGPAAANVLAFAREGGGDIVVAAIPRLVFNFASRSGLSLPAPLMLSLPSGKSNWRNVLTNSTVPRGDSVDLAEAFRAAPILLVRGKRRNA